MNTLDARRRLLGRNVYKRTTEGNPAIAQGSLARMYPGIEMQGWTEQAQYEGKNLFDKNSCSVGVLESDGSVNPVSSANYRTTDFIPVSQKSYTCTKTGSIRGKYFNSEKEPLQTINFQDFSYSAGGTINVPEGVSYIRFSMLQDNVETLMLNEGSTALPYEPYTGGQPSPSPDYPQEIVSAGKYNEETRKYEYEVKLTGGNLFNPDGEIVDGLPYDGIPLNNKGIVSMALYEKNQDVDVSNIYFGMCSDKLNSNEAGWAIANGAIQTGGKIIAPTDNRYVCWYPGNDTVLQKVLSRYDVMVNYGDGVYLPYQPYKNQTVTLTSDRPLTKWDKLEKRNGQWGWAFKSGTMTLNETQSALQTYSSGFYFGKSDNWNAEAKDAYSDKLININRESARGIPCFSESFGNKNYCYVLNVSEIYGSTVEEIKQNLSQNPIMFYYETAEETFVPLSESEQEQMNALYTFRPITVLSNDCDCNMSLTYKTKKSMEVTT